MSKFIAIEGVIGVGKTTLARMLKPHYEADILLEVFEENPFLADFYSDRDRYAFQTQLFFLLSRYQQQKNAVPAALQNANLISDYTFAKDELFAWLNLKDDELSMYGRVHSALAEKIRQPDLLVYLYADHPVVMQRIALRDRPYERDMDPEYISRLASAYEAWLSNLADIPVLRLDVTQLDFISRQTDLNLVVEEINKALEANGASAAPLDTDKKTRQVLDSSRNLANFQNFHRHLDRAKGFDSDLFLNVIGLTEEVGELSKVAGKIWGMRDELANQGEAASDQEALNAHRQAVGNELADIMAYILKIANTMNIDLEQAYVRKMRQNVDREWS